MRKSSKGRLSMYLKRVMKQKALTLRDIELRSAGEITDGYVADILRGAAKNPSAEKIKALALGLDVDAHSLFDVICGPFKPRADGSASEEILDAISFLDTMQDVAESLELRKIVQEAIQLSPEERAVVLISLESINERKRHPQRAKRSPGGTKKSRPERK